MGASKTRAANIWWVATHVEDVPPDEQERRWKQFTMPSMNSDPSKA